MNYFNHSSIGFGTLSIAFVLNKMGEMPISKTLLIIPLIKNAQILAFLSNGKSNVSSIEKLIIDKTPCFSNFNRRYYDSLPTSLNSIQLLYEMECAAIDSNTIRSLKDITFNKEMGDYAKKLYKASDNLSKLMHDDVNNLYLNLRVQL